MSFEVKFESCFETFTDEELADCSAGDQLSFFDSIPVVVFYIVFTIMLLIAFKITGCSYDLSKRKALHKYDQEVTAHQIYTHHYKLDVEFWHVMSTGECVQPVEVQTFCDGMKELRKLALDESVQPTVEHGPAEVSVETPEWQALLQLMEAFGPKLTSHTRKEFVEVVRNGPIPLLADPISVYPTEPDIEVMDADMMMLLLWGIFVGSMSLVAGITLNEKKMYIAFTRHTYVSRVFGVLFVTPFTLVWLMRGLVNVWDWANWYQERYFARKRSEYKEAAEAAEKARKQNEAIALLDGDLRANYDAILHAQQEIESLIRQAPKEDAEIKARMKEQLAELEEQVLTLHEYQDARDKAKRQRKLLEIASKVDGIVADVRGRMDVVAETTESETERIA